MDKLDVFYVLSIIDQDIKIKCQDKKCKQLLKNLGAKNELFNWNIFHLQYKSESDLANTLMILRDCGAAFASNISGWPPAGIIRYLKDKGLFKGDFKEIIWLKPGHPLMYDVKPNGAKTLRENNYLK